eukprot:1363401-Amorphochlora_amoeboformis.AAC.1
MAAVRSGLINPARSLIKSPTRCMPKRKAVYICVTSFVSFNSGGTFVYILYRLSRRIAAPGAIGSIMAGSEAYSCPTRA